METNQHSVCMFKYIIMSSGVSQEPRVRLLLFAVFTIQYFSRMNGKFLRFSFETSFFIFLIFWPTMYRNQDKYGSNSLLVD